MINTLGFHGHRISGTALKYFMPCGKLPEENRISYLFREAVILTAKTVLWSSLAFGTVTLLTQSPLSSLMVVTGLALISFGIGKSNYHLNIRQLALFNGSFIEAYGLYSVFCDLRSKGSLIFFAASLALGGLSYFGSRIKREPVHSVLNASNYSGLAQTAASQREISSLVYRGWHSLSSEITHGIVQIQPEVIQFTDGVISPEDLHALNLKFNSVGHRKMTFYYFSGDKVLTKVTADRKLIAFQYNPSNDYLKCYLQYCKLLHPNQPHEVSILSDNRGIPLDLLEKILSQKPEKIYLDFKPSPEMFLRLNKMHNNTYYSVASKESDWVCHYNKASSSYRVNGGSLTTESILARLENVVPNTLFTLIIVQQGDALDLSDEVLKRIGELNPKDIILEKCLLNPRQLDALNRSRQYPYAIQYNYDKITLRTLHLEQGALSINMGSLESFEFASQVSAIEAVKTLTLGYDDQGQSLLPKIVQLIKFCKPQQVIVGGSHPGRVVEYLRNEIPKLNVKESPIKPFKRT